MDNDSPSSMDEFNIDSGGAAAAEMSTASLSEVLASRSRFLEEIELWALCRECCLTLEYVHDCADLFQSLCISPDTVAFDPEGNVCFLDLDMEPDAMFIAPENESSGGNSYKSHLFSLGMTLLFATEYNTKSDDPRSQLGDEFTDLLSSLTNENMELRPDLDTVILACDRALGDQQSQEICFQIIGFQSQDSSQILEPLELSPNTDIKGSDNHVTAATKDVKDKMKDINENSLQKPIDSACQTTQSTTGSDSSSFEEEESSQAFVRKQKGLTLTDVVSGLDRFLLEVELWAVCHQCLVALQNKGKHLPAYISPDTISLRGSGAVSFKPIPEDKPLEMIYMAPELQQKGILNDKTCLYGLGKSLQTAGGCKYSSTLSVQGGEALEILVQAFIQTSPDLRTNLETAFEMCEEYYKVNETSFIDVCQNLYQEASNKFNPVILPTHQPDVSQQASLDKMSIPGKDAQHKTNDVTQSISLFKPVSGGGAFKPILPKPIPRKGQQNMPTAFISPATHFKPIVVEETHLDSRDLNLSGEKSQGVGKEINVVTKLKEIKDSLLKRHNSEAHKAGLQQELGQKTGAGSSQQSSQPTSAPVIGTDLSQEQLPNADLLVSAIAQYLKSQLMKTPDQQANEQKGISHTAHASDSGSSSKYVAHMSSQPAESHSVQDHKYLTWQSPANTQPNFNSNTATLAPRTTNSVPFHLPEHSDMYAQRTIPELGNNIAPALNQSSHSLISNVPFSTSNVPFSTSNHSAAAGGYPVPYSSINTAKFNGPFPFYQDSSSGMMMSYPYPPSGQGQNFVPNFPVNMGDNYASSGHHFNQGQLQTSPNYFPHVNYSRNGTQTFPSTPQSGRHQMRDSDIWNQSSEFPHPQRHERHRRHGSHHRSGHSDREASISHSSTPSPSKDSGIFLSHLPYNKDNILEKLLKSQRSHKQEIIYHVLGIIRDHFAEDGMTETGFDDFTIAEYIISLSSLTWDTFCSAITEKYFHLLWTPSVLQNLYDAIGGPTSQQSHLSTNSLTRKHTQHDKQRTAQPRQVTSPPSTQYQSRHQHHHRPSDPAGQLDSHRPSDPRGQLDSHRPSDPTGQLDSHRPSDPTGQLDSHAATLRSTEQKTKHSGQNCEPDHKLMPGNDARKDDSFNRPSSSSLQNASTDHMTIVSTETDVHQVSGHFNNQSFNSSSPVSSSSRSGYDKKDKRKIGELSTNPQAHVPDYPIKPHISASSPSEHINITHNKRNQAYSSVSVPNGFDNTTTHFTDQNQTVQSTHSLKPNPLKDYGPENGNALSSPDNNVQALPFSNRLNTPYSKYSSSHSRQLPKDNKYMSPNNGFNNTPYQHQKHSLESSAIMNSNQKFNQNNSSQYNDRSLPRQHQKPVQRLRAPSAPNFRSTKSPNYIDSNDEENLETEFNTSAEMRKLAAKKPELFKERRTSDMLDKRQDEQLLITHKTLPNENPTRPKEEARDLAGNNFSSNGERPLEEKLRDLHLNKPIQFPVPVPHLNSGTKQRSRPHSPEPNKSSNAYARSLSAVYTNQQPERGIHLVEDDLPGPSKRGSGGSPELPGSLLPYTKKGQVVYHSAMIQLSLTPEVDTFINSIDEENKLAIENRLSSIGQEILVLRRQRKKTQRFYNRLNKGTKVSKGDQHVSEQTMKELNEVTKKLAFLQLCRTHLEMLLAELNGLETCFLYPISASEGNGMLNLQSCMDNPYLQFRTISSPGEGQMSILQAGTPRGLMSYLYKSSALSDGYIHQFLLCFRYILTSDQLLTFILDKCHSAQGTKTKDVNVTRVERRSLDLVQFWLEGFYSIDFAPNKRLMSRLAEFLKEQMELKVEGADNMFSMYAACRMGDHTELMMMTEMDEDAEKDNSYFLHLTNSSEWDGFKSLLKQSKSEKLNSGLGSKTKSELKISSLKGGLKEKHPFSVFDCPIDTLAEQLTLIEQEFCRKCHPVHFLNSQFQGVGVALSMPGLRTPSMSRKSDPGPKKGLFVGEPVIPSGLLDMISHSQELAHWVSAEVLSCGSNKHQVNLITKFLTVAILCLNIRNFATALSILDGLENLVVKQLPAWKNISSKYMAYMNELANTKMKLKSEAMLLMSEKNCHVYPTIPCALYAALQLQQLEIGSFTLANGMFKWDKVRSITEAVDQMRIFRDHEYGFKPELDIQQALHRYLKEYCEQDLHAVASTQDNNFRRHSSSSSLSGTLKKVKEKLQSKKK